MTYDTPDYPDWALAEYDAHEREHAAALRRLALDGMWLRFWLAFVGNAHRTNATARRYDAALDAGMARVDAERAREGLA